MAAKSQPLKAPFPYFGGKSKVADLVWSRLGDVDNYVEPFCGSAAVLLRRPAPGKIETVNDRNHFIVNFWRAVQRDPEAVAHWADHPVTEADLHARHRYLMLGAAADEFRAAIESDPEYCDPQRAGWWAWGMCCWIGGGWCDETHRNSDSDQRPGEGSGAASRAEQPRIPAAYSRGVNVPSDPSPQIPDLSGDGGASGRGVASSAGHKKAPRLDSRGEGGGVTKKLPLLNSHDGNGTGVAVRKPTTSDCLGGVCGGPTEHDKRPRLAAHDAAGTGVHGGGRPQLGDAYDVGRGVCGHAAARLCDQRRAWLVDWMGRLADRLRLVRVCYGHWSRICDSHTTVTRLGTTGAFLDPPYAKNLERLAAWIAHLRGAGPPPATAGKGGNRADGLYHGDASQDVDRLVAEVHLWCEKWAAGGVRIALCGYAGEHDRLEELGWQCAPWKAHGGYGNRNAANANKHRERIWFSPACVTSGQSQRELFS